MNRTSLMLIYRRQADGLLRGPFSLKLKDQCLQYKYVLKDTSIERDSYRLCGGASETIQHITSSCPVMAQNECNDRYDAVTKVVHQELPMLLKIQRTPKVPYYKFVPAPVLKIQRTYYTPATGDCH